jgi:arylsulfatase A-like enzyme
LTNISTKSYKIAIIVSLIVGIFFVSCYPLTTGTKEWRIKWDKTLLAGKKLFLKDKLATNYQSPNIILIVADDLGLNDVSCYNSPDFKTPNIDALAKEGVRCTNGYVTSPICAPSRCGILTGRYQERCGFETIDIDGYPSNLVEYMAGRKSAQKDSSWVVATKPHYPHEWETAKQGIPPTEITLAELLKKYSYNTAIIGKWHLGTNPRLNTPTNFGFNYQYGCYSGFTLYADRVNAPGIVDYTHKSFVAKYQWQMARKDVAMIYENNKKIRHEPQYFTDAIRDRSLKFIEANKEKPFFLYIPFTAPHEPYQAKEALYNEEFKTVNDKGKAVYRGIIRSLDDAIGAINQRLKDLKLDDNTLIVLLSDNGPALYTKITSSAPLKGGKITQFEGGINVPFIMKWKNHIPENTVYENPVISLDIFATAAAITSAKLPEDRVYDGVNLIPYLSGQNKNLPHDKLFWRADHIHVIRKGDYKLIFSSRDKWSELYNLKTDKNEKNNLYQSMPEKVKELRDDLNEWEKDLPAKPMWPRIMDHRFMIDGKEYLFPA